MVSGIYGYFDCINLLDLKQKVLDKGLPWAVIDETKAKLTCKTYDYEYNKLE